METPSFSFAVLGILPVRVSNCVRASCALAEDSRSDEPSPRVPEHGKVYTKAKWKLDSFQHSGKPGRAVRSTPRSGR